MFIKLTELNDDKGMMINVHNVLTMEDLGGFTRLELVRSLFYAKETIPEILALIEQAKGAKQ